MKAEKLFIAVDTDGKETGSLSIDDITTRSPGL